MGFALTSSAFPPGGRSPPSSPARGATSLRPLEWTGLPPGTKSLVLIGGRPRRSDPRAPRMTWVHWVLYNLPPRGAGWPRGCAAATLPGGDPRGNERLEAHRIRRALPSYRPPSLLPQAPCPRRRAPLTSAPRRRRKVEKAMQGHVLGKAELIGTYEKTGPLGPPAPVPLRVGGPRRGGRLRDPPASSRSRGWSGRACRRGRPHAVRRLCTHIPWSGVVVEAQETAELPDLRVGAGGELPVREGPGCLPHEGAAVAGQHLRGVVLRIGS